MQWTCAKKCWYNVFIFDFLQAFSILENNRFIFSIRVSCTTIFRLLESFCCWLKNDVPPIENYYLEGASIAGIVHRKHYRHPPTGMRSSVPLGGLAAGSFEMRADGKIYLVGSYYVGCYRRYFWSLDVKTVS